MPRDDEATDVRDDDDLVHDALSPYIADALAELALPPFDEMPTVEEAASELTEADLAVLNSRRSPEEVVARLFREHPPSLPPARQMEFPTISKDAASTQPESESSSARPMPVTRGIDRLLESLEKFEADERVEWSFGYTKTIELGRGGQGVVYLAECQDEFAAVKALKIFSPRPYGDERAYNEDMQRMSRVASRAHHSPHDDLLDVEWFGQHDGIYAMLMQLIDGCDLWRLLQPSILDRLNSFVDEQRWQALNDVVYSASGNGQLGLQPGIAVYIVEKCLRGLDALHSMDIVHGDIKPSNIMLDRSGGVKLIDLGSAFETTSPARRPTWTPRYAAPEFLERGELTPKSDLASLGYVLIELLSGQPVIGGPHATVDSTRTTNREGDRDLVAAKKALPDQFPEMLPEKVRDSELLVEMCGRLIDADPENRFPTAGAVIDSPKGPFTFFKQLCVGNLAASNFQETKRWLADVRNASQ